MRKKQQTKRFIKRFQSELITLNVGILAMSTLLTLPSAAMLATTNEGEPVIQIQEEGIWREQGLDREYGLEEDFLGEIDLAADEKEVFDSQVENLRETSLEEDEADSDSEEENLRESNLEENKEDSDESDLSELSEENDEEADLSELNEENGEEADLSELNEENDEEEDLPELDQENDEKEGLPELSEEESEEEEEEVELIPVIGVTEKAELEKVYERAGSLSELQTIVNTASTGVNTVITITADLEFTSALNITAGRHITIQSDSERVLSQETTNRHFTIDDNSSLTLETGIVLDGLNNESVGGGIQVNNGGHFIMQNGSIRRNRAGSGGGVSINSGGEFTMIEGSIKNNTADSEGGGIYAGANTGINILGGFIEENKAGGGGGGVMLKAGAKLVMKCEEIRSNTASRECPEIRSNTASRGGGLFLWNNSELNITGGRIHNNTATSNGGGIYAASDFTVLYATIDHNNSKGDGGGIYVENKTFNMQNGTIFNNTAVNRGGGVFLQQDGAFKMHDGTIQENNAREGGGIHMRRSGFEMENGKIIDNTATSNGGGIYTHGNINIKEGTIQENKANHSGGGIYQERGTLTMNGGKIYKNEAVNRGGGVFSSGGTGTTVLLDGVDIHENKAGTIDEETGTITNAGNGAGIFSETENITMIGGTVTNNTATGNGGGIWASGTFTMHGGAIDDNKAANGGGIWASGTFTMHGGAIDDNKAANGGGIFIHEDGSVTLKSNTLEEKATINENKATNGGGALVNGTLTMEGGEISLNKATNGGGALVNGTFVMNGGGISLNEATRFGGGVWIAGTFDIQRTDTDEALIDQNKARMGAGVYIESGSLTMTGGKISGNDASLAGGGVFSSPTTSPLPFPLAMMVDELDEDEPGLEMNLDGVIFDDKPVLSMTLAGVTIDNNKATLGGGVFSHETNVTMTGGSIQNNHAIHHLHLLLQFLPPTGAGLWASGNFIMEGGAINHNESAGYGGGVFIYNNGTFSAVASNSTEESLNIYENKAAVGGGVAIASGGSFEMNGGNIRHNEAIIPNRKFIGAGDGGGVAISRGGKFNMRSGDIHTNKAAKDGGGVVIASEATFEMVGGNIHTNEAVTSGGGVMVSGAFSMVDGNISSNTASVNGGGVSLGSRGGTFNMSSGDISSNRADQNGGGIFAPTINLKNLYLNENVTFSENSAIQSYPPPLGVESELKNVLTNSSSVYHHPLNNYDIGYSKIDPPVHTLSIERNPIFGGDVVVGNETNLNNLTFMEGVPVNLEAQPKPGYRFVGWTSSDDGEFTSDTEMNTVFTTPGKDTAITATFERMIFDPLYPDKEVSPENPPIIPDTDGFLSIDFVSSFDFGEQTISTQKRDYYAKPQQLLDEKGLVIKNEVRPNYIQISDDRAGDNNWSLSVTQMGPFKDGEDELRGAELILQHAELISVSEAPLPHPIPKSGVTLEPNHSRSLITAEEGEGGGTWIYRFGNETNFGEGVKLEVPRGSNPSKTTYRTTLNWELKSVPGNLE